MSDDTTLNRILDAEEVELLLAVGVTETIGTLDTRLMRLGASHEALRAALVTAERRAENWRTDSNRRAVNEAEVEARVGALEAALRDCEQALYWVGIGSQAKRNAAAKAARALLGAAGVPDTPPEKEPPYSVRVDVPTATASGKNVPRCPSCGSDDT